MLFTRTNQSAIRALVGWIHHQPRLRNLRQPVGMINRLVTKLKINALQFLFSAPSIECTSRTGYPQPSHRAQYFLQNAFLSHSRVYQHLHQAESCVFVFVVSSRDCSVGWSCASFVDHAQSIRRDIFLVFSCGGHSLANWYSHFVVLCLSRSFEETRCNLNAGIRRLFY